MSVPKALVVPVQCAQNVREKLEDENLWDGQHRLQKVDTDSIAIPVLSSGESRVKQLFPDYKLVCIDLPVSRKEKVKNKNPLNIMKTRILTELKKFNMSEHLLEELPKKWTRHGDLVLLPAGSFTSSDWDTLESELWKIVSEILSCRRLAKASAVSQDGFRSPQIQLLLGENGLVTHVDNGITYTFDATKCMFSSGNITEKLRVAGFNCKGQTVVDLYAGIGYFTLPYLVHAGAAHVHACEWNPAAAAALRNNLVVNAVETRCTVHEGDNRLLQLTSVADVVNLGLIPSSEPGWPVAAQVLSQNGGILHVHGNVSSQCDKKSPHSDVSATAVDWQSQEPQSSEENHQTLQDKNLDIHLQTKSHQCFSVQEKLLQHSGKLHDINKPLNNVQLFTESCERDPESKDHNNEKEPQINSNPSCENIPLSFSASQNKEQLKVACDLWSRYVQEEFTRLLQEKKGGLWSVREIHIEVVKSYAPCIWHVVLDLDCQPVKLQRL